MNKNGPIIVIEDDEDDQQILTEVFASLPYKNQLIFFTDGQSALDFLNDKGKDVNPFLILSDINMPKLNGFALREKMKTDAELQLRCIPYLFFTTTSSQKAVVDAYSLSVQGFFIKQTSMQGVKETIVSIMEYWRRCAAPNNFGSDD
jgi:CheY-like chemotaxis protein